jgi:acetyltransferase
VQEGQPLLIAVARLVADPDHEEGDYGVLVADDFQRRGLGRLLTEKCIEVGRRWGLARILGETTADNVGMLRIFHALGFAFDKSDEPQILLARLALR